MLLLCCCRKLMIKRPTIAACNGRFRRRKNSAIRTLVAETLVLAKTHGYVEKIESELEAELARDISDPPEDKILRWRRKGDLIFKSKHVLLTVVILCVVDCALVLGELALDLYKVKATLAKTDELVKATHAFVSTMEKIHPDLEVETPYDMFNILMNSDFSWNDSENITHKSNKLTAIPCSNDSQPIYNYLDSSVINVQGQNNGTVSLTLAEFTSKGHEQDEHELEIIGEMAHVCHHASIAILFIIMLETILKAICAGKSFFHRRLEVFDAMIVLLSFFVDFCFLAFLPDIDTKDFVFILAILLPWRVIRVVNSLVVSVKDHEHFRLKLVYKRKKKIQCNLRDTEAMLQKYVSQVTALQRLCIMEGIEEWKIDNYLKNEENAQPVTPSKRKFKFKFEDIGVHGHNRGARCSMPSLDFHGVRFPSSVHVSRSRISLPAVANSIKNTLSKTLPSRRASLASMEAFGSKMSNGDVRKKKMASEDLGTMEEEDIDDLDLDNHDSALSSRATSESGDVFSRLSVSDSFGSDRIFTDISNKNADKRRDSVQTVCEKDEREKMVRIKEEAKRRHSESNLDKQRVSLAGLTEGVCFTIHSGKTYTKPQTESDYNKVELHSPSGDSNNQIVIEDSVNLDESESKPQDEVDVNDASKGQNSCRDESELTDKDKMTDEKDLKDTKEAIINQEKSVEIGNEMDKEDKTNSVDKVEFNLSSEEKCEANDKNGSDICDSEVTETLIEQVESQSQEYAKPELNEPKLEDAKSVNITAKPELNEPKLKDAKSVNITSETPELESVTGNKNEQNNKILAKDSQSTQEKESIQENDIVKSTTNITTTEKVDPNDYVIDIADE